MYRLAIAVCLALMSCACSTMATKGATSTLVIPPAYMEKCPDQLPDLTDPSKEALQENRKETQRVYFKCSDKHGALVDELQKQGVKPAKPKDTK